MKKVFITLTSVIVISSTCFAQSKDTFEKGTNVINLGFGIGNTFWGAGYGSSGLPVSLNASFDHGITDKIGIGHIGVGAQVSYASSKYAFDGVDAWKSTGILIAARGTYHFEIASAAGKKLDPYAGILLGYVVTSYSYNDGYGGSYNLGGKSGGVAEGIFAGAHYYIKPRFGVYGEIGYTSFSILNLGVSFKL